MGRLGAARTGAARHRALPHLLLLAAILAGAAAASAPEGAPPPAWAQASDETAHGRLAVEEPTYVLEGHMPVTVRISGQIFAESDERRQVAVVVTLPDSSRSEQAAWATREGHFAVPYQLDKPFPTGADSRPGRYRVSASHGGASLGAVHFDVVRPPQVPAPAQGEEAEGAAAASGAGGGAVTGLTASVGRPVYSPDAAVTVHGTAEGAGAGVRLRIDIAGPSAGVVYSGALTTSAAGTYSATVMAPDGRWGGDGEYAAVVTGAGQLARAPFWVESGWEGGGGGAATAPPRAPEGQAAPAVDRIPHGGAGSAGQGAPPDAWHGGGGDAGTPAPAPSGAGQGGAGGGQAASAEGAGSGGRASAPAPPGAGQEGGVDGGAQAPQGAAGGMDVAVIMAAAAVAVAAAAAVAVAIAARKISASGKGKSSSKGRRPAAHRPAAPARRPPPPNGRQRQAAASAAVPHGEARRGMRVVLDMSVVINHKKRSAGELKSPNYYGPQLDYVDAHREDLLLPERDMNRWETREYAAARLKPFERVYGYERHEAALENLRRQLVDDPLKDESVRWIAKKLMRGGPWGGDAEGARINDILSRIGMPRRWGADGMRAAIEAVARHGESEDGREDLAALLRRLSSDASQDLQILAIAMSESERHMGILLTTDYDLFAFPIWRKDIDASKCGPVTMVLGPTDIRWIVSMRDGSAIAVDDKAAVKGLYSDEEYAEASRALQYSVPGY